MAKKHKYNAKKTTIDNILFDSKEEAAYYEEVVKPSLKSGAFKMVECHPKYTLIDQFEKMGQKFRKLTYSADFKIIFPDDTLLLVDVKGMLTKDFKIKYKLFNYLYPDIKLILVHKEKKEWVELKI